MQPEHPGRFARVVVAAIATLTALLVQSPSAEASETSAPAAARVSATTHRLSHHQRHCLTKARPCAKRAKPRPKAKPTTGQRARLLAAARRYIGRPYVYGSLDCSGFTQKSYAAIGKRIPRTAYAQARAGRPTRSPKPGDILVYGGGTHVALVYAVSHGRVTNTLVARHTGTVIGFQKPYTSYRVVTFLA